MALFKLKSGRCSVLLADGTRLKMVPGDTVTCEKYELPQGALDQFEEIVTKGAKKAKEPDADLPDNFDVQHKGGGWYNVINKATGEAINERPLKKLDAYALAGSAPEGTDVEEDDD